MVTKILRGAESFKERVAQLKKESPYYPDIVVKEYPDNSSPYGKIAFASTLVRIEREGIWYTVHCVESVMLSPNYPVDFLYTRLMDSVHKIQHLYIVGSGHEDVDPLQISELERLRIKSDH